MAHTFEFLHEHSAFFLEGTEVLDLGGQFAKSEVGHVSDSGAFNSQGFDDNKAFHPFLFDHVELTIKMLVFFTPDFDVTLEVAAFALPFR